MWEGTAITLSSSVLENSRDRKPTAVGGNVVSTAFFSRGGGCITLLVKVFLIPSLNIARQNLWLLSLILPSAATSKYLFLSSAVSMS